MTLRAPQLTTLAFALLLIGGLTTMSGADRDLLSDTWAATDALGRTLPAAPECRAPRADRFVGIFYFLWQERRPGQGLYDNSKLLAANPTAPQYGPLHAFHWWGQPHLGYYIMDDPFVIRKHAQMLTDAGVDFIVFDATNAFTYAHNYQAVCEEYRKIRAAGRTTPQIAFMTHARSGQVVQKLYDELYGPGLYSELWFRWQGKPLILATLAEVPEGLRDFFTVRESWAWTGPRGWFGDGKDKWPWVDNCPQNPGWHDSPDRPEEIAVAVAQHPTSNIGRSFHDGKQPPPDQVATNQGLCFAEQLRRALDVDPQVMFITGWNEWIAQRFVAGKGGANFLGRRIAEGETFFVDQYNQEFSRDIEPMRGGHGDDYYYQMAAGIRRFKGARPVPAPTAPKSIQIGADFAQWQDVGPEYLDDVEDTLHRNHPSWGDVETYVNDSGRNDFDALKVARDSQNLYFYARTRQDITAPGGPCWMMLLLNTDGNGRNGWEGYDFAINRLPGAADRGILERSTGGWNWEQVAEVPLHVQGNELQLAMPRAALGLAPDRGPLRLEFKWADNVPQSGDILDFIDHGDVAPNGRFNYVYTE
jgi:hypothetical protein